MGFWTYLKGKVIAFLCLIGSVLFISWGLTTVFNYYGLELPPINGSTILGTISLVIGVVLFVAAVYYAKYNGD